MEQVLIDFIQEIISANQIPFHHIQIPCEDWDWLDLGLRSTLLGGNSLTHLNDWCKTHTGPFLYYWTDSFQCSYISLNLPDSDEWLFVGPVLFDEIKDRRFDELFQKLGLPERARLPLLNHYYNVKLISWHAVFESFVSLIADHIYGKGNYSIIYHREGEWDDWSSGLQNGTDKLSVPENPFLNIQFIEDRYDAENALLRCVSAGNEMAALKQLAVFKARMFPQRLSNELRDAKNYTITLNTLLRKAAEEGGVHPYHIDRFSNSNVQKLEQLTSPDQCQSFQRKITRGYCKLVKEFNLKDYSIPVRKAITYINADLCADLSLKTLAGQLNMNASYLSALFRKETGATLTEFVSGRRIAHAQKLLRTTTLPIQSISLQCGISDMYYFSRLFKRIAGCTPKAYRERGEHLGQE